MLPNKKTLRMAVPVPNVPKWVVTHWKHINNGKTIIEFAVKVVNHKKLLCAFWYSKEAKACTHISYLDKSGEIITRTTITPIKWYVRDIENLHLFLYGNSQLEYANADKVFAFFNSVGKYKNDIGWLLSSVCTSYKMKMKKERAIEKCKETELQWEDLTLAPKDFKQWCDDTYGYNVVFDVIDRHKGWCSHCENEVNITEKIIMGHLYKCPHCGKTVTAISRKKLHNGMIYKCFSHLSLLNNKLVVRHYELGKYIYFDKDGNLKIIQDFFEYERDVFNSSGNVYYNYIRQYNSIAGTYYWNNRKLTQGMHICGKLPDRWYDDEYTYPYNINAILYEVDFDSNDKAIDALMDYAAKGNKFRIEMYMLYRKKLPAFEILYKAGYNRLANDILFSENFIDTDMNSPKGIIGMNKTFREYAKENNFGTCETEFLRDCYNSKITLKEFDFLYQRSVYDAKEKNRIRNRNYGTYFSYSFYDIKSIFYSYLSAVEEFGCTARQLIKYLRREQCPLEYLKDYYSTYQRASELAKVEMPTTKNFYFPYNLKKAHDNAVAWLNRELEKKEAAERAELNKKLQELVSKLSYLDNYKIGGMVFVIPHCEADFVLEGTNQGHCVGNGYYMKNMINGTSFICFMRKAANVEKSYITIEFKIKNNEFILSQCHLSKNRDADMKDKKIAVKYGKLLQKEMMKMAA